MNANLSVVQLIFLKQLIDIQTIEKMKSKNILGRSQDYGLSKEHPQKF